MAEKKWKRKQIRLQDFEKNIDGKYEYRGAMYKFSGDFRAFKVKGWILIGLIVVLAVGSGILPATGMMDTWYVIIPYAVTVAASGFCLYRMIQWSSGNGVIREYNYERSKKGFPNAIKVLIASSGITFVMEVFYLVSKGMGDYPVGAVILLVSMAIILGLGIALERLVSLIFWEKLDA